MNNAHTEFKCYMKEHDIVNRILKLERGTTVFEVRTEAMIAALDKIGGQMDKLVEVMYKYRTLDESIETLEADIKELNKEIVYLKERPAKKLSSRWEIIVSVIITAITMYLFNMMSGG